MVRNFIFFNRYILKNGIRFECIVNEDLKTALRQVEMLTSPRLIKSHLPLPLLPAQLWSKLPKLIYVYRDPKDALISQYNFGRSMGLNMHQTLEQFLTEKIESRETECDFDHVTEFYFLRSQPWLYYTSFERMKMNLRQIIEDICQFLDRSISEEQMHEMLKHLSFEEMKDEGTYCGKEHLQALPKSLLLAQTEDYVEYSRSGKGMEKPKARSIYEDIYLSNILVIYKLGLSGKNENLILISC